jgi:hypothetical protein
MSDMAYDNLKGVSIGPIPQGQPGSYAVAYRERLEARVASLETELRYARLLLEDVNNSTGGTIRFPHAIFARIDTVLEAV